jgi:hypothetical protein
MFGVKEGDRIGVILKATKDEVHFLGWGVYEGMHPKPGVTPPTFEEMMADPNVQKPAGYSDAQLREAYDKLMNGPLAVMRYKAPRLRLDNGKEVWGHEVWWGRESEVRQHMRNKRLILVDIDKAREDAEAFKAMVAEERKAANG